MKLNLDYKLLIGYQKDNKYRSSFDQLAKNILESGYKGTVTLPKIIDANTPMERKKMYVKCPTGYLFELKGYK